MEKFEVYNRELNTWQDEKIAEISGWDENWVQDKTTDNAKVKLKYKGLTTPKWDIGDWCRLLHINEKQQNAHLIESESLDAVVENEVITVQVSNIEDYNENDYIIDLNGNLGLIASVLSDSIEVKRYFVNGLPIVQSENGATYKKITVESGTANTPIDYVKISYDENIGVSGGFRIKASAVFDEDISFGIAYLVGTSASQSQRIGTMLLKAYQNEVIFEIAEGEQYQDNIAPVQITSFSVVNPTYYIFAYLPQNNEQFVIKDFEMVEDIINNQYDIQLQLGEPIDMTNGISCETMSFTNQTEKVVDGETYIHEPLTHYSVLEKILKVTPSNNDIQKSWFSRIKILDKEFLKSIPFNDETYNEPTLYNILLDKFDSSIGRTPVMYFDVDAKTDLPNNLERTEYLLNFERQDGFDKAELTLDELSIGHSQILKSKTFENYAQGITTNFDNLVDNKKSTFVSEFLWTVPEVNSNTRVTTSSSYGQNSELGIWVLKTPHKIKEVYSVEKIDLRTWLVFGAINYTRTKGTIKCLEEKQYNASSQDEFGTRNVVWYKEGENIIHLNDFYNNNPSSPFSSFDSKLSIYRVEYQPLISGRIESEGDYKTIINQIDSQVDSEKFGKYLEDYEKSMNKVDLTISKTVENFEDIAEIGSRVVDGDKIYLITNIGIQNRGFDYDIVYQLNENHFRRNDSIVAPQEIRKNIEISIDATKERKTFIKDTFKLSTKQTNNENMFNLDKSLIFSQILNNFNISKYPQIAYLKFKSILTKQDNTQINYNLERLCEIAKFICKNKICFNMRYIDNAEAGKIKQLFTHTFAGDDVECLGAPDGQVPILYTNPFGEFKNFDLKFIHSSSEDLQNYDSSGQPIERTDEERQKANDIILQTTNYPLIDGISTSIIENPVLSIEDINYEKDMLDIWNYTFGIIYESSSDIVLCKNFFNNNNLINNQSISLSKLKTYSQNMQENDFASATEVESSDITSSVLNGNEITITLDDELQPAKCIALVDENNEPLLIINDFDKIKSENFNSVKLYC